LTSNFELSFQKYQYNTSNDGQNLANLIRHALKIAINTLDFQFHNCEYDSDSFSNNQNNKLNSRLNLFEFEQITREKYSEISKNSVDLNNIYNQNNSNVLQNAGSSAMNLNNHNNLEIGLEEDSNLNMLDENDENLSISDKSSNKIINLSSPVKNAAGFKSSIRSKSRSSIKSSMIKPIQSNLNVGKKNIKSTGAGISSSKLMGDVDEKKRAKSARSKKGKKINFQIFQQFQ
jgi:hypothetical protein